MSLLKRSATFDVDSFSGGTYLLQLVAGLYAWVPQHLIAGSTVVFTVALIALIDGPLWLRTAGLGVLLAFDIGSSVFVSLGLGAGIVRAMGEDRWR